MPASRVFSGAPSTGWTVFSMPMRTASGVPSDCRMILEICQKRRNTALEKTHRMRPSGSGNAERG